MYTRRGPSPFYASRGSGAGNPSPDAVLTSACYTQPGPCYGPPGGRMMRGVMRGVMRGMMRGVMRGVSKHSPGPWTMAVGKEGYFVAQAMPLGVAVCHVPNTDVGWANAALIAAAPEMLALLREVWAQGESFRTHAAIEALLKRLEG